MHGKGAAGGVRWVKETGRMRGCAGRGGVRWGFPPPPSLTWPRLCPKCAACAIECRERCLLYPCRVALRGADTFLAKNVDLWRWLGALTTVSTPPALEARAKR